MENENEYVENINIENNEIEKQNILSLNKFIFLSIISFGTYQIWWIYKSWKFFKQKDELDINPILRALFSIFYLNSLFSEILDYSHEKNYTKSYSSSFLFFGFIISKFLSKLPDLFWLISSLSFIFLIPPFLALNFAKVNSKQFEVVEQNNFSMRQILLIVIGIIFWCLVILGLNTTNEI